MKTNIDLLTILSIAISILFIGWIGAISWEKWLLTVAVPLPQKATAIGDSSILLGSYYEVSIPPSKEDEYQSALYRIWIPKNVKTIRGLIVKQHGCGDPAAASGLDHAKDLQWQALAAKHNLALLGTKYLNGDNPCENWVLINYGSGDAFLKALRAFAEKSQHPELEMVPWVIWGHSGGADWGIQMLQEYPERTIAAIAARGGALNLLGSNPTLANIPVLFAIGEKDTLSVKELQDLPRRAFLRYRKMDAPWALAIEAQTGHETGDTRLLAIPYLDAILTARLSKTGNKLLPIDKTQGWLGDTVANKITPASQFEGNHHEAAWLPNEETAHKWHEYVTKGKISPTRKPFAPTNLRIVSTGQTKALLTWCYTPDLENGLPSFHVYRDGVLIKTFRGQEHNFGDVPKPANVLLEFTDNEAKSNSTYTVGSFNLLGENVSSSTSIVVIDTPR
jgi:hypothetical protein